MNNRPTMLDEWMQPNPSPRTLIASFLNDDFTSRVFPDPLAQTRPEFEMNRNLSGGPASPEEEAQSNEVNFPREFSLQPRHVAGPRPSSSNGGLAERMAARAGFNVPKLNTSWVNPVANVAGSSSEGRSPYLMIPPGLSPTTLLESPVFLSNLVVQPSPTTGKLPFMQSYNVRANQFGDAAEAFSFKPSLELKPSSSSMSEKKESSISFPVQADNTTNITNTTLDGTISRNQEFNFNTGFSNSKTTQVGPSSSADNADNSPPPDDPQDSESDLKAEMGGTPADDGYNWRKYGQKQVKTSEFPRSYYKCTHLNCPVKKKVERSHDGQVTEIIYKGTHNHQKPSASRRSGMPFSDGSENPNFQPNKDSNQSVWGNGQNGSTQEGQGEGVQEVNPAGSVSIQAVPEFGELVTQVMPGCSGARPEGQGQDVGLVDLSSTVSNEEEDQATRGASLDYEADEDDGQETDSKRRKLEACAVEINAASRAVREPRVVVQTTSEVDILDDGYRWRKYGQKVVKGNPNPRSYYKCTNPGCSVRKHVERASHDLKSVITTYEGRHNHEVPAARNSGGHNSTATAPAATALPPQPGTFSRRPDFGPDGQGQFNPTSLPLGPYGLPPRNQLSHLGPHGNFSFPMGHPGFAGFRMAGLGPGPPLPPKVTGMPMLPPNMGTAYLGHNGQGMEGRFVMPKGEMKEEDMTDSGPRASNGASTSNMAYQQMINRMHMGP